MFSILKVNTLILGLKGSFTRIYGASADSADFQKGQIVEGANCHCWRGEEMEENKKKVKNDGLKYNIKYTMITYVICVPIHRWSFEMAVNL